MNRVLIDDKKGISVVRDGACSIPAYGTLPDRMAFPLIPNLDALSVLTHVDTHVAGRCIIM